MQIAIRDDQARTLQQTGSRGNAAAAPVHSFDDLVRALGARKPADDARPVRDDHATRDRSDRREPFRAEDARRDDHVRADRSAPEREAPPHETDPVRPDSAWDRSDTAEATTTTDAGHTDDEALQADGQTSAQQPATNEQAPSAEAEAETKTPAAPAAVVVEAPAAEQVVAAVTPKQTLDASAKPAVQPAAAAAAAAAPAATAATAAASGTPGAAPAQPQETLPPSAEPNAPGTPARDGARPAVVADAAAPSQVQPASAKPGGAVAQPTATAPETPITLQGLTNALLAQTMVARPASQPANAANAAQPAGAALQKAIGKAINVNQAELGARGDEQRQLDFKSVAAALFNRSPGADAAPRTATGETASAGGTSTTATGAPALGERAAPAAQANAASAPAHSARTAAPQLSERIGMTIVRAAESGVDQLSIRLNPRELGRIDVRMDMGQDGRLNLTVSADRQDTLDQLQRNGRDLERALSDAGFNTGAGDLSFSLRDQQAQNQQGEGGSGGAPGDDEAEPEPGADAGEDGMIVTHNDGSLMVVDLFV